MRFPGVLAACCCLILFSSSAAIAQNPVPSVKLDTEEEKLKKKQLLEQKALAMLDQLIEQAPAFRLPENRIWVLSVAADLLWTRDEKRARALFNEVTAVFVSIANQSEEGPDSLQSGLRWNVSNLRGQILRLIAARDLQLASTFLTATRPPPGSDTTVHEPDQESHLEMMIIQQMASKNPQEALKRAEEMLASDKPLNAVSPILEGLRMHDPDAARKLVGLLVPRLVAETPPTIASAQFSLQILRLGAQSAADEKNREAKPLLTTAQARSLIENIVGQGATDLAARIRAEGNINQLKPLMPYIEKHSPASLPLIKKSATEVDPGNESARYWEVMNQLVQKGAIDELVAAAAQAPQEMRLHYYQSAAIQASAKGDDDLAQRIIKEHITDSGHRKMALEVVERQRLQRKTNEGKIEDALQLLPTVRTKFERVNMLVQIAAKAGNSGRQDLAVKLLDDAWKLVSGPLESSMQFQLHAQISTAYLPFAPARSFEIIEGTIDRFNELFAASAILLSFEAHGAFREREMVLSMARGNWMYQQAFASQMSALAAVDIDRVQSMFQRLAFPDQRASLQLEMLGTILRGNNTPPTINVLSSTRHRVGSF